MSRKNTAADFWKKVDKGASNGCWQWLGSQNGRGYAQWHIGGKTIYVHRYAYNVLVGEVTSGLIIDHLCRNRSCVNPKNKNRNRDQYARPIASAYCVTATHCAADPMFIKR